MKHTIPLLTALLLALSCPTRAAESLTKWSPVPADWKGVSVTEGSAKLSGEKWSYLFSPNEQANAEVSASLTITEAAKQFRFFGESWSVWPDATFGDGGFEAALLLRARDKSGYRIQLSHKYQMLALVKWPEGGFVRVVPCAVKLKEAHKVLARAQGSQVTVSVDGEEKIRWRDEFLPLEKGYVGLGVSSGAKVDFTEVSIKTTDSGKAQPAAAHKPQFSVRPFLGGRPWVFDRDEPILLLPVPKANGINNVKLRPGYKPQLSWNSHWDVQNQGAYKEADNKNTEPICTIIGVTIALSREQLLSVGLAIFAAAACHNASGYLLGYWGGRLSGLNETDARTCALEVGIQNGGMATGLAFNVLQSPAAALGAAVFGPWSAITSSALASWWRRRPINHENQTTQPE